MCVDIAQHNTEIHENLAHWNRKPVLRGAYARFYREIAQKIADRPPGLVVECGSGIGNLKTELPDCIATDLFPNPWIDRTEDVYALSFAEESVSAFILFDVFHHLQFPGAALAELARKLKDGGRLVIFEPALGLLGRCALGLFHHEPLGLGNLITWDPPPGWSPSEASYYAAQGNAWRIFHRGELPDKLRGWQVRSIDYFPALLWLMSGGFRGPALVPRALAPVVHALERPLASLPRVFATRMLIVLEKS